MRKKVLISNPAKRDIAQIIHFIRLDKPAAAENFKKLLLKTCRSLTLLSERGRKIPELKGTPFEDYREIIVGPCRLLYRPLKREVRILRILHSRRVFTLFNGGYDLSMKLRAKKLKLKIDVETSRERHR